MNNKNNSPYTIKLFLPDGNSDSIKIIEKFNWTGVGVEVARESWENHKNRDELSKSGVYILIGYEEDKPEKPSVYIGQGDDLKTRIEKHVKEKDFWDRVIGFTSKSGELNRAHITWLEWALINEAQQFARCNLQNSQTPNQPRLVESDKIDTKGFLAEILSVLPIIGVKVFEKAKRINISSTPESRNDTTNVSVQDTIIVPAQEDGFKHVFIVENKCYEIRIGGGRKDQIKYIAAYQSAPISAITHYAEVDSIEAYGDGGKYQLNFKAPAKKLDNPIGFGDATPGFMMSSRYTSFDKLMK